MAANGANNFPELSEPPTEDLNFLLFFKLGTITSVVELSVSKLPKERAEMPGSLLATLLVTAFIPWLIILLPSVEALILTTDPDA